MTWVYRKLWRNVKYSKVLMNFESLFLHTERVDGVTRSEEPKVKRR